MKGIRIEFPKVFYPEYTHKQGDYGNWGYAKDTVCPMDIEEIRTDGYIVSNAFWAEDGFYTKVIYDDNYKELKKTAISQSDNGIEINHGKNLVRYKNTIPAFIYGYIILNLFK